MKKLLLISLVLMFNVAFSQKQELASNNSYYLGSTVKEFQKKIINDLNLTDLVCVQKQLDDSINLIFINSKNNDVSVFANTKNDKIDGYIETYYTKEGVPFMTITETYRDDKIIIKHIEFLAD